MKLKTVIGIGVGVAAVHLILREIRQREPDIHFVEDIPGNFNGMTLPPIGIFISKGQSANTELLKHEMVHWRQYQRMGLIPYYFNYIRDYLRYGYDKHPMEYEARKNESEAVRNNYTEAVRSGAAKTVYDPNFRKAS